MSSWRFVEYEERRHVVVGRSRGDSDGQRGGLLLLQSIVGAASHDRRRREIACTHSASSSSSSLYVPGAAMTAWLGKGS